MKITIYYALHGIRHYLEEKIQIEVKGSGTKQDPFVIETPKKLPRSCVIRNQKGYIVIKNQKMRDITFINCYNITLKNCDLYFLTLEKCGEFLIKDLQVFSEMKLIPSQDISINECNIKRIKFNKSFNCEIKNSVLFNFYESVSKNIHINSSLIRKFKTSRSKPLLEKNFTFNKNKIKEFYYETKERRREVQMFIRYLCIPTIMMIIGLIPLLILSSDYEISHPIVFSYFIIYILCIFGYLGTLGLFQLFENRSMTVYLKRKFLKARKEK